VASNLDRSIDRLYGATPEEFTQARRALEKQLREAGDRDAAERVKSLRKPTVAAWAVNQLARKEKRRLRTLFTAGDRLRRAQASVLKGGSPATLRKATEAEREAVRELTDSSTAILREAGHNAATGLLRRLSDGGLWIVRRSPEETDGGAGAAAKIVAPV
jgi:hypothetical protein